MRHALTSRRYPGKGKHSHPTKMPTLDPHDPKPRDPKRTQSCRSEPPGQRHARYERRHAKREKEREAIAHGTKGMLSIIRSPRLFLSSHTSLPKPMTNQSVCQQSRLPVPDPTGPRIARKRWPSTQRLRSAGTRQVLAVRIACETYADFIHQCL